MQRKQVLFYFFYGLLSLLLAIVFTYPLITDLSQKVFGFSGDNFSSIWYFWWLKHADLNNLNPSFTPFVSAPFGHHFLNIVTEVLWTWPMSLLTRLFNEVVAFNVLILASFPLSAITTHLLVRYISRNFWAAFFAGIAFAFAPYHFWQGYAHLSLAQIQWMPLYILSLFYFDQHRSLRSGLFVSASLFLVTMTTFYYGYFMVLFTVLFFAWKIIYSFLKERRLFFDFQTLKLSFLSLLFFLLLISPFLYQLYHFKTTQEIPPLPNRPLNDLLSLSLRPWDLLIPAPNHFLLGEAGQEFYKNKITKISNDYKSISAFLPERVLFVGFSVFLLSLSGIVVGLWRKKYRDSTLTLLFLTVGVLLLSLPPIMYFRGQEILLPNYYLYQYIPYFRAYVRLGIVLLLLMLLLSSFTISSLMEKLNWSGTKALVLLFLSVFVLAEYLPRPGSSFTDLTSVTKAYHWLKEKKSDSIIAEYPKTFDMPDALIMQRTHQKKLFNPINLSERMVFEGIHDPYLSTTQRILSSLGVNYLFVHTQPLYDFTHPIDDLFYTRYMDPHKLYPNPEPVYFNQGTLVYELAKSSDLAGAIFSLKEGFQWPHGNEKEFLPGTNYIYLGNFTKSQVSVDLEINKDIGKAVYLGEIKEKTNSKERIVLREAWNVIEVNTPTETNLKINLSNFKIDS